MLQKGTTDMDAELEVNPQTVFCAEPNNLEQTLYNTWTLPGCHYDHSDMLWEWDWDKAEKACTAADESGAQRKTARWYQTYLSHFYDKPVAIKHILAGYDLGNGYPYQVFGTCNS